MPVFKLAVVGFPGYAVGTNGSIWTAWNNNGRIREGCENPNETGWKQMKLKECDNGYLSVSLSKDGKKHHKLVHRIVLEAFVGPCPEKMECRHGDGNKHNNRTNNLSWGTHQENMDDQQMHGTTLKGETNRNSKLTEDTVLKIVELLNEQKLIQTEIAELVGVVQSTIGVIARGKAWKYLTTGLLKPSVGHWTKRVDADRIKAKMSATKLK